MTKTSLQSPQLTDATAERVRRNHEQAIEELQSLGDDMDRGAGRLLRAPRVFTTSGVYKRAPGTAIMHVRICGGGGGSGGAAAGAGVLSVSGSGASGVTLDLWLSGTDVGDAIVTIGAPGAAGAAGANPGGAGGDTTFAIGSANYLAKGGGGGQGGNQNGAVAAAGGGNPGTGSTAGRQFAMAGDDGLIFSAAGGGTSLSSRGGSSAFGVGGFPTPTGFGAGGGSIGAVNANVAGVAGTGGIAIIEEYADAA